MSEETIQDWSEVQFIVDREDPEKVFEMLPPEYRGRYEEIVLLAKRYCDDLDRIVDSWAGLLHNSPAAFLSLAGSISHAVKENDSYDYHTREYVVHNLQNTSDYSIFIKIMNHYCPDRNIKFRQHYLDFINRQDVIETIAEKLLKEGYTIDEIIGKLERRGADPSRVKSIIEASERIKPLLIDSSKICIANEFFERFKSERQSKIIDDLARKYNISPEEVSRIVTDDSRIEDAYRELASYGPDLAYVTAKRIKELFELAGKDWRSVAREIISQAISPEAGAYVVGEITCPGRELIESYERIQSLYNSDKVISEIALDLSNELRKFEEIKIELKRKFGSIEYIARNGITDFPWTDASCVQRVLDIFNSNFDAQSMLDKISVMKENFELLNMRLDEISQVFEQRVCSARDKNEFFDYMEKFAGDLSLVEISVLAAQSALGLERQVDQEYLKKKFAEEVRKIIENPYPQERFGIEQYEIERVLDEKGIRL